MEYSVEKKLKIIINEKDIEEIISKNEIFGHLKNISEINPEFIKLIYLYKNKNIIEVIFSENSYILKKINEYFNNEKKEKKRIKRDFENEKMKNKRIKKDLNNEIMKNGYISEKII